jgi:hypothetical protein
VKRPVHRGIKEQIRHALEQLSLAGPEGATPADLGITATLLERLITLRLAERLAPLYRGASYRYRISEKGSMSLIRSDLTTTPVGSRNGARTPPPAAEE